MNRHQHQHQQQKNKISQLNVRDREYFFEFYSENSPYAMLTVDKDGLIVDFNLSAEQLLGFSKEQAIGQLLHELIIPPRYHEKHLHAFYQHAKNAHHLTPIKKQLFMPTLKSSGETVELDITLFSIIHNNHPFYTALLQDNVVRKQMIISLNDALEAAQLASHAKSSFLANMSHEIRSPMNIVLGMSRLLAKTVLTDKQSNYVSKVETASVALLSIINHVLDFSKIEAHKVEIDVQPFQLSEMLKNHNNMVDLKAQEKGVDFEISIEKKSPQNLIGDPLRLNQILHNLVFNAIKFTPAGGGVKLFVSVVSTLDDEVTLLFSVTDTGIGLTQEQQTRLFQPFQQADNSTTRNFGGTGLGLAISKQLVELMGGEIGVNSEFDKGSTFWFTAKFRRQLEHDDTPSSLTSEQENNIEQQLILRQGAKILVVDDILGNQELIGEMLNEYNFEVEFAANGQEAIAAIEKIDSQFDLVLMDLQMPVMGGVEATEYIRQQLGRESLPIVAMTGNVMESDRQHCFNVGMVGHIAKPIDFDELYNCLIKWIRPNSLLDKAANCKLMDKQPSLFQLFSDGDGDEESRELLADFLKEDETYVEKELTPEQLLALQSLASVKSIASKPTLLIINNDSEERKFLQQSLQQDYHLLISNSASGSINIATIQQPDLVLIDDQMPDINGFNICTKLKADSRNEDLIVILLMTINSQMNEADILLKAFMAGADDCLYKPIDKKILKLRINKLLDIKLKIHNLKKQIHKDTLTGLTNRHGFELQINIVWKQLLRTQLPLSIIFVKINQLKQLVVQEKVDESVMKISEVLNSLVARPGDLFCRYDRDTFVCLLPNTHEQGANWLANYFWDSIDALHFTHTESGLMEFLSISVGGCCTVPAKDGDPTYLIEQALQILVFAEKKSPKPIQVSYLEFFGTDIQRIDVDSSIERESTSTIVTIPTSTSIAKTRLKLKSKGEPVAEKATEIIANKTNDVAITITSKVDAVELIGIDKAAALKRVRGKERLFNSLLAGFVRDFSAAATQIREALKDNQDLELAQRTAHSVKGMAGNISAQMLFDAAYALEMAIKNKDQDLCLLQLEKFELQLQQIVESIRCYQQKLILSNSPPKKAITPEKATTHEIDRKVVLSLLNQLSTQLEDTDLQADETFEALKTRLSEVENEIQIKIQALGAAIDELDYTQASEILATISQQLELALD